MNVVIICIYYYKSKIIYFFKLLTLTDVNLNSLSQVFKPIKYLSGTMILVWIFFRFIVVAVYLTNTPELQWGSYNIQQMVNLNANQSAITKATCATEIKYFSFGYLGLLITAVVSIECVILLPHNSWSGNIFQLLEVVLVGFSVQGTIMNPEPRKPLQYIIYFRIGK